MATIQEFPFNQFSVVQKVTVPSNTPTCTIECWGAQGGSLTEVAGGKGGYTKGTFEATPGELLSVLVGGAGGDAVFAGKGSGSGGGGASAVWRSTGAVTKDNVLIVAEAAVVVV